MKLMAVRVAFWLFVIVVGICGCDSGQNTEGTDEPTGRPTKVQSVANGRKSKVKVKPRGVRTALADKPAPVAVTNGVSVKKAVEVQSVRRFAEDFRALRDSGSLTAGRIGVLALECFGSDSFVDIAESLCAIMVDGTAEDRKAVLAVLCALRREWVDDEMFKEISAAAPPPGEEPNDGLSSFQEAGSADADSAKDEMNGILPEVDDVEERATMAMMTICFSDKNTDVRDAAYEALMTLPKEERTALSLQLLGNDDVLLKEALLEETRNASDDFSLTLNFHGLDSDNKSVRDMAAANILEKTGKTFSTTAEAFEWHESRLNEATPPSERLPAMQ